jgi:signal transduction histidine kinase/ActR/RegA family two-component response regulator
MRDQPAEQEGSRQDPASESADADGRRQLLREQVRARWLKPLSLVDDEIALAESIVRGFVPGLADWCVLDLLDRATGEIQRAAAAHRDPEQEAALRAARPTRATRAALRPDAPSEPVITFSGADDEGATRPTSAAASLFVPLVGREGVVGVLRLGSSAPDQAFAEQLKLAEEIAAGLALALENSRLFREARDASRAKDEFLAILGHELRNPLAPISTALELMRMKGLGPLAREHDVISRQLRHMTRLVEDLLDVSRVARGSITLRTDVVDLFDILAEAVEAVSPLLEKKELRVSLEVPRGSLFVDGDRVRLIQVFSNLLNNAAKWSRPRQSIEISGQSRDGGFTVKVKDHGAGIAPELLPHLFGLFSQGPQARDRADGGLGVGLSIVRSLVRLHGGEVEARSDGPGAGSEFVVRLPPAQGLRGTADTMAMATPAPRPGQRRNVLVVDDNLDAAEGLAELLRASHFEVRVAGDGIEALRVIEGFRPEIGLLDIGLPAMDGYELARRLRLAVPAIRLIAISGYAQEVDVTRSRAAGFEHHLAKPVDWSALLPLLDGAPDYRSTPIMARNQSGP